MYPSGDRPDPDALLRRLNEEQRKARRGTLRVYLGACAGVGKTCAMLNAAHQAQQSGVHVVAGVIETHGRQYTAQALKGLPSLPMAEIFVKGPILKEFDLDAALASEAQVVLLDELAHSNAPGSRHAKRWQDAMELVAAGKTVWTTLNIQHLESLNTTVGGITGVRVHETLPDAVLEQADEVLLVDTTADEVLRRLEAGQIYSPEHTQRALNGFFRKGNLIALRELALRKTADRVESEVVHHRNTQVGQDTPSWNTSGSVLVCVGTGESADHVVRAAAQMAQQQNAAFYAVYVETPALQKRSQSRKNQVLSVLQLAQDLGARTRVLTGHAVAESIAQFARQQNCQHIVLGRGTPTRTMRKGIRPQLVQALPEASIIEVGQKSLARPLSVLNADHGVSGNKRSTLEWRRYAAASLIPGITGLLATPLLEYFDLANIVMIFLASVVVVAYRYGRGPAMYSALLNVAIFDFFFVSPRFSFAVSDVQYLLTFVVMLAVGLLTGHLTARLRFQAQASQTKELRAQTLFDLSRELSSALETGQVVITAQKALSTAIQGAAVVCPLNESDALETPAPVPDDFDASIAQWVLRNDSAAGASTATLSANPWLYLPLKAPMRVRGVLAVRATNTRQFFIPEQRQHLETMARQIAIALERIHYVEVAHKVLVRMESETLRGALLAAISHDIRTPLTALTGTADTLARSEPALATAQAQMAEDLSFQARRLTHQVNNLLDMARLQTGAVQLNRQWEYIQDVAAGAVRQLKASYPALKVHMHSDGAPRLVDIDAVLMERVFFNLLDNACKYGNPPVSIETSHSDQSVKVRVIDAGQGALPKSLLQLEQGAAIQPFTRGHSESPVAGFGLGLSIIQAVVHAHGGHLTAFKMTYHGLESCTCFEFTLPTQTAPDTPELSL